MQKIIFIMGLVFGGNVVAGVADIVFLPVATLHTPDSILQRKESYRALKLVDRWRYGTCTSAVWFDNTHLAALNLYAQKIEVYECDMSAKIFRIVQHISNEQGARFMMPEHFVISSDHTLLLVANSFPASLELHAIDMDGTINSNPLVSMLEKNLVHNVRFTPNGRYCACATFDPQEAVLIYNIIKEPESIRLQKVYCGSHQLPLCAKAVIFTRDGRYMIVAYALSIVSRQHLPAQSILEVYEFDQEGGVVGNMVCCVSDQFSPEDLVLVADERVLIAPDQSLDALIVYPFDNRTGIIGQSGSAIIEPLGLSFPHGISVSPDGRYIAVANYGDDSVKIYALQ